MSFWLFIDANSPATSSSYTDYANIVSFGDNPAIEYNTSMRQLRIAIKEGPAVDKMRVIYETHDFPLQRWNHVVVNNSGGTMDIFINNALACSEANAVPYHKRDAIVVGQPDGINGGICNFVYFTHSLDTYQMYFLHELVSWKTPPVFATANVSIDE